MRTAKNSATFQADSPRLMRSIIPVKKLKFRMAPFLSFKAREDSSFGSLNLVGTFLPKSIQSQKTAKAERVKEGRSIQRAYFMKSMLKASESTMLVDFLCIEPFQQCLP